MKLKKSFVTQTPILLLATENGFNALQANSARLKEQHSATSESNATLIPAALKKLFAEAV